MKANEAPEKLYYAPYGDIREDNPITDNDIEYIRKDAFIEKAYDWLKNHYRYYMYNPTGEKLEAFFGGDMCIDFESYMKGE